MNARHQRILLGVGLSLLGSILLLTLLPATRALWEKGESPCLPRIGMDPTSTDPFLPIYEEECDFCELRHMLGSRSTTTPSLEPPPAPTPNQTPGTKPTARLSHPPTSSPSHTLALSPPAADWTTESDQENAHLGQAISTAGDVNRDGYSDLVVGAPDFDGAGAVLVYHGGPAGLSTSHTLIITGPQQTDARFGAALSLAGDVNGDGYADLIVGAPGYDGSFADEGAAWVYYGGPAGLTPSPAPWIAVGGQENAHLGAAVSTAGDVDGDGYSEVIIGAPDLDGGAVFIYYGSADGLSAEPDWTVWSDQPGARFGAAVATAGDVNGDGFSDVAIGAPGYDLTGTVTLTDAGQVRVYHGSAAGLAAGPASWVSGGGQAGSGFGAALSTAGDVNGDGYADLLIGAPNYTLHGTATLTQTGQASIYYGSPTGLAAAGGWSVTGDQAGAHWGAALSTAGDVNSDGYADLIIGAPGYDGVQPDEGAVYVYYGSPAGPGPTPTWSVHPTRQENAHFGIAVATAGDVNGDGHSDLAIGAPGYDNGQTDEGGAFVYHGHPDGLSTTPAWSTSGQQAGMLLGWSVALAGDVNGDGFGDLIVGAPRYERGQIGEGGAFLYLGGSDGPSVSPVWIGESDQEWARLGSVVASAGDVNGDGFDDIVVGAPYYDGEARDEGAAFIYHGGVGGPAVTPTLILHPTDQADARFGAAVASAGDVNGDGFDDLIVTAPGYDAEATNEGAAFVFYGGPSGLITTTFWSVHPTDQPYAKFGRSASTAGDVNGDGFSDVIIGASWVARSETEEKLDGAAYVYHGGPLGLGAEPDWITPDVLPNAEFGIAVATAGDVNGDGFSDVIIGAYKYTKALYVTPWREGAALVYYGGPAGLRSDGADWMVTSGQEQAKFGIVVAPAGDVDGDGFSDVIVGASNYADAPAGDESSEGAVFVYHGGPGGLSTDPTWSVQGNQKGAALGFAAAAGDVNGDGYSDLVVGAPTYNDPHTDEGAAFVYLGNGGSGRAALPRQMIPTPLPYRGERIPPSGQSSSANQVRIGLTGRSPLGRESVALTWQVAPLGVPFTSPHVLTGTSSPARETLPSGVPLGHTVAGLAPGTVYRWRARIQYETGNRLGQPAGRWFYPPGNGLLEADFRTPRLLTPDREGAIPIGQAAVYTHTLFNPVGLNQTFTLTGVSSLGCPVSLTLTSPLSGSGPIVTATVTAFGWQPFTVTIQFPSTVVSSTRDTTIITATGSLSGQDVIHDRTIIGLGASAR
ncbi:MAG TPA: hypothetical protein ENN99_06870 [Chloroflexi bacterium]|nr:hypothetical protein [Chloroflexota bacterium]